jgi:hypothetical protein
MAPISKYDLVFGWVDSLSKDNCIICFNSSDLEEEVMKALLVNEVPTILVVMNRFTDKYNVQIMKALEEDRILILVLQRDEPRGSGATPRLRNEFIIKMAVYIPWCLGLIMYAISKMKLFMEWLRKACLNINVGKFGRTRRCYECFMRTWGFMPSRNS